MRRAYPSASAANASKASWDAIALSGIMPIRRCFVPRRRACSTWRSKCFASVSSSLSSGAEVFAEIAAKWMPSSSRAASMPATFSSVMGIWDTSTTSKPVSFTRLSTGRMPSWATCSLSIMSWIPIRAMRTSWGVSGPHRPGASPRRPSPSTLSSAGEALRILPMVARCRRPRGLVVWGDVAARSRTPPRRRIGRRGPGCPGCAPAARGGPPGGCAGSRGAPGILAPRTRNLARALCVEAGCAASGGGLGQRAVARGRGRRDDPGGAGGAAQERTTAAGTRGDGAEASRCTERPARDARPRPARDC